MKRIKEKVDLVLSIRRKTVIIFTIGALVFALVGLIDRAVLVQSETKKIQSEYTDKQKQIIRTQVENAVMFIILAKEAGISKEDIIKSVRKIRFGKEHDGYIFIVTYKGTTLLNDTQRQLEGKNIWNISDPDGVKFVQEMRLAVQNAEGDFIYYFWNKPSTKSNSPKVSFIKGVSDWEWMVGSGVYLDSIEDDIAALRKAEIKKSGLITLFLILVFLSLLIIIQFIFKQFTEKVSGKIQLFSSYFDSASMESKEIDISGIRYKSFSSIAEDMNRMIKNKQEADAKTFGSEQRLFLQREQSPLGYLEYDLESKIIYWNPAAERIFGYSKEEILGRSDEIIVPPEIISGIKNIFKELIDGSVSDDKGIKSINDNITKDGRRITCEWYNKALIDQEGKVIGFIALVVDITERKLMEEKLQESVEEKKVLLKEVHHRVKNNMAIISSFLSLQSMNIEDEYVCSLLQSSENRVRSMALIHEHLYKSESLKDISVQTYIEELIIILLDSYGYGAADITVIKEIMEINLDLDLLIPLGMIVNEIISNALKHAFTNIDSPELYVSFIKISPEKIVLTIRDNGVGLPEESEISRNDSIGFLLINGLAQQINGKIEINRGHGTEYRITIPV